MDTRELLSAAAIGLTFAGFLPYIRAILQGRIRPHVFSWVIWGATTFSVFLAQLADHAGVGAWPIGVSGIITLYIALLAFLNKGDVAITRSDWLFLLAAMSALPLWYATSDPFWAVAILTSVDLAGFGATLRKAWRRPHEEQLTFFGLFALRNLLVLGALEHYSFTTVFFPLATGIACLVLILMVGYRRRRLLAR